MLRNGNWRRLAWAACLLGAGGCALPFSEAGGKKVKAMLPEKPMPAKSSTPSEPATSANSAVAAKKTAVAKKSSGPEGSPISDKGTAPHKTAHADKFGSQLSLARLSERHGQYENAAQLYEAILRKEPKNLGAHQRLAVISARDGKYADAEIHFQKAGELGADDAEFWSDRGYCAYLQGHLDEAEKHLRLALKRDPHYKAAHNNLGLVLGEQGKFDESLAQFRKAVGEAEAYANLAFVKAQGGDYKGAERDYHQALRMDGELRSAAEALVQLPGNRDVAGVQPRSQSLALAGGKKPAAAASPLPPAGALVAKHDTTKATRSQPSEIRRLSDDIEGDESSTGGSELETRVANAEPAKATVSEDSVKTVSYEATPRPTAAEIAQRAFQQESTAKSARPTAPKADERRATENPLRTTISDGLPPVVLPHWQRPTWTPPSS